jgi:hypothetical protein
MRSGFNIKHPKKEDFENFSKRSDWKNPVRNTRSFSEKELSKVPQLWYRSARLN